MLRRTRRPSSYLADLRNSGPETLKREVDPEGQPWVVYNEAVHRRTAAGWVREPVPGEGFIEQVAGIERGTPWIRRGGSTYVHGLQLQGGEQILARGADGRWRSIEQARGVLMPDERLHVDILHAGADGMRMTAHGETRLARPEGEAQPYTAILTTVAVPAPLRCGGPAGESVAW